MTHGRRERDAAQRCGRGRDRRGTPRWAAAIAVCAALAAGASGCRSLLRADPAEAARREAGIVVDHARTGRERLAAEGRLAALGAAAEPHLRKAFFPIGIYDVPLEALDEMAAAGFNLVVNADKDSAEYLRRCETLGLRVAPYVNLAELEKDVRRFAGRRVIYAWYLFDEPDLNEKSAEWIAERFRALRAVDQGRPIYLVTWSPKRYAEFMAFCDVFGCAPYPIVRVSQFENELRWVGAAVDAARRAAGPRPVWAIAQAFWAEPHWPRNPTPEELRAMVYIALNHGARGIVYFGYRSGDRPITAHKALFAMMRRINGEIRALKAPLLKEPIPGGVAPEDADTGEVATVDCSIRAFGRGYLMMVVNPDPRPKKLHMRLGAGLKEMRGVSEWFSERRSKTIPVGPDRRFRLLMAPFETRVLMLEPDAPST